MCQALHLDTGLREMARELPRRGEERAGARELAIGVGVEGVSNALPSSRAVLRR